METYPTPKKLINNFLNGTTTTKSDEELNKIMFQRLDESYNRHDISKEEYEEFKKYFEKIASFSDTKYKN